ncbi:ABC transporter ATP-binding protein [Streptacidiphilus sp. P02-A3a]|uniref:ABC transporter ATP-binding protein n=1 Tax=Streptacidiphilus sp. P02-A3a TaxID=2704468 RepID=UPI0015FA3457|nr:ABC transporter ATP-binding protein [Streptacidiphilus sp. P02-A3a]QMU70091.1 ABC transporter ATP-binding protein [Streptacidiphilus sp. P02-A3a]QMU70456.1 ABC transporter ATP-binding protein [Streptacidiphilus sp. P02-A3a]
MTPPQPPAPQPTPQPAAPLSPGPQPAAPLSAGPQPAAPLSAGPLLVLDAVSKRFTTGRTAHTAVDGVTLAVPRARVLGLVGESGSGKSTLARLALGLIAPDNGTVRFEGHDPHRLRGRAARPVRARLQFVPQNPGGSLNPALRAGSAVALALAALGVPRAARAERTAALFQRVALDPALARRYPRELSGGQLQRVAIARALATGPDLIVLDEPTSALDRTAQSRVLDLLAQLRQDDGVAYLLISHDLAAVRHLADQVSVLRHGQVVEQGPTDRLWQDPRHPYTRALLDATTTATTTARVPARVLRPSATAPPATAATAPPPTGPTAPGPTAHH